MELDYHNFESYLQQLDKDIYEQPSDPGHTDWAQDFINSFLPLDAVSILDVGCGDGFCKQLFPPDSDWVGITKFKDDVDAKKSIYYGDMNFLEIPDNGYDLIFARHVLEHSPMPLITLMEWHRVSCEYLMLVLPAPEYWTVKGKNHYYVLPKENWEVLFDAAGWKIVKDEDFMTDDYLFQKHYQPTMLVDEKPVINPPQVVEYRFLLEKISE